MMENEEQTAQELSYAPDQEPSPPEREAIFHQLRAPVQYTIGRTAIVERLAEGIRQAAPQGATTVMLYGSSGVGKTELAYMLAQQLERFFPDAHLYLEMRCGDGSPRPPQQVLQQIIHTFKPQAQVLDDLATLRERTTAVLQDKRVLILADDVQTSEQIAMLQPPPGCVLLITSSEPLDIPATICEPIPPLTEADARQLLLDLCPNQTEHIPQLAAACGYQPLALRLVAGMLAHDTDTTISPAMLLDQLSGETEDSLPPMQPILQTSYAALGPLEQATLRQISVFTSSFDMEAARAVVSLHGISPTKPPTQKTVKSGELGDSGEVSDSGDSGDSANEKPRGRAAPPAGEHIMHQLWSRNLVDYDSPIESYTLHPLVREFATTQQREAEAGVFRRYAKYYAQIATDIESLYLQGGDQMLEGLDIFDQERSHIEASWIWAKAQGEDTLLLQFLCIVGHTGLVRYHIRHEYIPRAEETLAAARRLKRRGDECHLLNVLGSAYRSLGDLPTAISYYKKALELLRTVRKQSNEVSVLGNLGNAYLNLGDRKQATKHYKRSLNTARKRQDVRGESAALGQLGLAHAESGEYDHAIALYEQSLTIARQHRYRDYEEEILTGLGTVYLEQGELENARAVCEGALHIIQETGNRRDEGYAYLLLGKITAAEQSEQPEQAEQSPPQAEDHYHTALTIAREIGDKRMEGRVLQANGALALTQQQGAYAQSLLEEALAIAQATGDRRGEAMSSWQLGVLLQQQTPAALEQAVELMQVRVAYEQAIDHPAAADHQQQVAAVRQAAITRGQ